jgi:hypothetical protein
LIADADGEAVGVNPSAFVGPPAGVPHSQSMYAPAFAALGKAHTASDANKQRTRIRRMPPPSLRSGIDGRRG